MKAVLDWKLIYILLIRFKLQGVQNTGYTNFLLLLL